MKCCEFPKFDTETAHEKVAKELEEKDPKIKQQGILAGCVSGTEQSKTHFKWNQCHYFVEIGRSIVQRA